MDYHSLASGWSFCPDLHAVYHFEHFPVAAADEAYDLRGATYVIETVNWTGATGSTDEVHRNLYFADSLAEAISKAATMLATWQEVAEDVVGIRLATDEEELQYIRAEERFDYYPEAFSDEEVAGVEPPA